jgi:GGDEF domain-containing protein
MVMQPPPNDNSPQDDGGRAGVTADQSADRSVDDDARGIAAMMGERMGERTGARPPAPSRAATLEGTAGLVALVDRQITRSRRQHLPFALLCLVAELPARRNAAEQTRRALTDCASRLCSRVRATDHVARYGPCHFSVLLPEATDAAAWVVALRLLDAGSGTYRVGDDLLELRLRAGHAVYPQAAADGASLVHAATAMTETTPWNRRAAPADAADEPLDWGPWWR